MSDFAELTAGIRQGHIVPYLGPGVLQDVKNAATGAPMPADSHSLILAMNGGQPMAPKLMYEFPRAAMNLELKKGRSFVTRFLTQTYGETSWSRAAVHDWLASFKPPYAIDINRDTQLQDSYADTPHTLIVGVARIAGTDYRFRIYHYDGAGYREVAQEKVDASLPILFKPMGTPRPQANFIASDADYVDYITELMGGFAIPSFLKEYRKGRQYLFIGVPMTRDTERMVLSDIIHNAAEPKGWVLNPAPTDKERAFCRKLGLNLIVADIEDLLGEDGVPSRTAA
ncbi:MAG TPA: SIR2 family protein [Methylococcaceae bacterium]|nr:SIR2 family protein [Methylococcaceae bacterium]